MADFSPPAGSTAAPAGRRADPPQLGLPQSRSTGPIGTWDFSSRGHDHGADRRPRDPAGEDRNVSGSAAEPAFRSGVGENEKGGIHGRAEPAGRVKLQHLQGATLELGQPLQVTSSTIFDSRQPQSSLSTRQGPGHPTSSRSAASRATSTAKTTSKVVRQQDRQPSGNQTATWRAPAS